MYLHTSLLTDTDELSLLGITVFKEDDTVDFTAMAVDTIVVEAAVDTILVFAVVAVDGVLVADIVVPLSLLTAAALDTTAAVLTVDDKDGWSPALAVLISSTTLPASELYSEGTYSTSCFWIFWLPAVI